MDATTSIKTAGVEHGAVDRGRLRGPDETATHHEKAGERAGGDRALTTMISPLEETAVPDDRGRVRVLEDVNDGGGCLGDRVGGRLGSYRIERLLGRGSMACVYKARHLAWSGTVPSRSWIRGWGRGSLLREQFRAEARAVAKLLHSHIVTIYNLGSEGGHHFIEMEYMPGGQTLRDVLVHEGPLDPCMPCPSRSRSCGRWGRRTIGLVHRDVKPANVLLTHRGEAKLADFGLVRRLDDLAHGGAPVAGTPTFMAPELFQGTPSGTASDIYALGVLLFYCLSGRLPVVADSVGELIQLHRTRPVPDIRAIEPGISPSLAAILSRCLAKDPADRYATAYELAEALADIPRRLRDIEGLVRESVRGLECFIQGYRDTFRLIVSLPHERLQEVVVEARKGPTGSRS